MKSLSVFVLLIVLALSFYTSSNAQTEKTEKENLTSFSFYFINGYALAYEYYKSDAFNLRVNLDLNLSGSNEDSDGNNISSNPNNPPNNSKEEINQKTDRSYASATLSTQIIFPIYKTGYGSLYFGIGPSVGYLSNNSTTEYNNKYFFPDTVSVPSINFQKNEYNASEFTAGANALIGLESIITKNISLFAEVHLNGGMRWTDNKSSSTYTVNINEEIKREYNSDGSGWYYSFNYVRMGVKISI